MFVDGQPAGRVVLAYNPDRIGVYLLAMPVTRYWSVDLQFMVDAQAGQPGRLRFWWAQVRLK